MFSYILGYFPIVSSKYMLCVLYRIASLRRFKWLHSTYHYFVFHSRLKQHPCNIPIYLLTCRYMINPQWLELPISRTNLNGPKDVRGIEVRLYTQRSSTSTSASAQSDMGFFFLAVYRCIVYLRIYWRIIKLPSGKHAYIILTPLNPTFI